MKLRIAVLVTLILSFTCPADASVLVQNEMTASAAATNAGLEVYLYGSGSQKAADFAGGTHSGTIDSGGALELDLGGTFSGWWDGDWQQRQCFDVKSAEAESEYPLRFEVDTSGSSSTGADIRVVEGTAGPLLSSYSEGAFPATDSVVWAQAEPLPAGVSTYCVYFGNSAATTVSDEIATFTYTSGQTVAHYTLSDRHFGNGVDSRVTVVSYSANNTVSDGTTTVVLNAGQFHTFTGQTKDSVITSTGPIEANYDRDGRETLIPEGYADTQFSFPTRRYVERFWVRSPHGNTTVEAVANGVVIASVAVGPADGSVVLNAPGPGNMPVSIRSTTGHEIIAMHIGTNRQDSMIGVPWFGDTLFGVASNNLNLGALVPTTVSWIRSDGSSNAVQAVSTNALTAIGGNGAYGNGRAIAVSGADYFHAAQQADNDGTEVTSFLPERLLGETFRTPVTSRYFSIACPQPGTMIQINGGAATPCNGVGVGLSYSGFGSQAAGTLIEADHPVFVYYETRTNRNETNLLGPRGNIPHTTEVAQAAGPVEKANFCGTWTSAVLPTSGAHGEAAATLATPAGTTAELQISTDGSPFYGPDGSATSSFSDGDIVPYVADFASTLQFRIELCTDDASATPTIKQFEIECDLQELTTTVANIGAISIASPAAGTNEPLLRVYQQHAGAWLGSLEYQGGVNLAVSSLQLSTDHPTTQITAAGGTVTDPTPTFSHLTSEPYTVTIEHKTTSGATSTINFGVVDIDGVRDEVGVSLTLVG